MKQKKIVSRKLINTVSQMFLDKLGLKTDAFNEAAWQKIILERMRWIGTDDEKSYQDLLFGSEIEFFSLLELVIVSETWFFREEASIDYAVDFIKERIQRKIVRVIDIPCCTGEEAYSLAIALIKKGVSYEKVKIDAIDVSRESIERAQVGIYGSNSFRSKEKAMESIKSTYFNQKGKTFVVNDHVKQYIQFHVGNILDQQFMQSLGKYDIVFCRNLFIYLDFSAQAKALQIFKSMLLPNGLLFCGATEFEILRRHGWEVANLLSFCSFTPPPPKQINDLKMDHFIDANKLESLISVPFNTIQKRHLEEASKLANQGMYDEALKKCQKYISGDGRTDSEAYFLMGVIEHACQHIDIAENCFLKTIYLKPNHMEALTYLALLAEQRGDLKHAELYRQRLERMES